MSSETDPLVGRVVAGKFELVERIGRGAMGSVYRAHQTALDKQVAIKVLHGSLRADPALAARFHHEARAAAALDHANSVAILDFGEEPDGLLYIAMEYLSGRDLFDVLCTEWPLDEARVVRLMRQVCAAVARAHDAGVIHRDLKPENIMVSERESDDGGREEVVKVCDFGIAELQRGEPRGPADGARESLVGTPEYMAPEVGRGEPPDGRSDVYALGVVLYQMLTRELPFSGHDPTEIVLKHITEPAPSPRLRQPQVSEHLAEVVLLAMSKDPAQRYPTARHMRSALRAALERRPFQFGDATLEISDIQSMRARMDSLCPDGHGAESAGALSVPPVTHSSPAPSQSDWPMARTTRTALPAGALSRPRRQWGMWLVGACALVGSGLALWQRNATRAEAEASRRLAHAADYAEAQAPAVHNAPARAAAALDDAPPAALEADRGQVVAVAAALRPLKPAAGRAPKGTAGEWVHSAYDVLDTASTAAGPAQPPQPTEAAAPLPETTPPPEAPATPRASSREPNAPVPAEGAPSEPTRPPRSDGAPPQTPQPPLGIEPSLTPPSLL